MKEGIERIGRTITPSTAQRMCLDKRAFESKNKARDVIARNRKLGGTVPMDAYKCPICAKYHLTSLTKEDSAAARRAGWKKAQRELGGRS